MGLFKENRQPGYRTVVGSLLSLENPTLHQRKEWGMSMKIISSGLDTNVRRVILVLAALVVACGLVLGLGLIREAQAVDPPPENHSSNLAS